MELLESEKEGLEQDKNNLASTIVDQEDAFSLIRTFRKEFQHLSAHMQHELLKNAVRRVVVKEDGIVAEYYGSPQEDFLAVAPHKFMDDGSSDHLEPRKQQPPSDYCRTAVRKLYNLVETPHARAQALAPGRRPRCSVAHRALQPG